VGDRCQKINPCRETTPSGISIARARRFVSWSCKDLRAELRDREKRYLGNRRLACGTASGRQVAGFRDGERTVDMSTAMSHRVSRDRMSRGLVYRDIKNVETPTEVRLRSYRRWSHGP
jgi:hypothetical protein